MKIGILTHHYVKNFGAYMQAYSLLNTINYISDEINVELIDYKVPEHAFRNGVHFWGFKPKRGDTFRGYLKKIGLFFKHLKYENGLPMSVTVSSASEINDLKYDLIVVGADEVWNFTDMAYSPIKFGVGITVPMISYSASLGGSSVKDNIPKEVKEGLNKFKAISVRDDKTEELVSTLTDKKAVRTLDPVFLYDYDLKVSDSIKKLVSGKPYILIYDCGLEEYEVQLIKTFAKNNGLNILGAGEYRKWYDSLDSVNISPFEWAYLFKNSWGVITGTFHGTSFAIKYNRRFVSYLTEINRVFKVKSLLNEFDLTHHIVIPEQKEKLLDVLETEIDYSKVNAVITERVSSSKEYLISNIMKE